MVRSLGFGSITYDLNRPFQTRFRFGSVSYLILNLAIYNNSPDRSTKSTTSHLNVLCLLVSIGFHVLFHSPPGVLFTFPSRYLSLSVTKQYLALWGGPHVFIRDFTCLALLWILPPHLLLYYRTFTFFGSPSQTILFQVNNGLCSPNPKVASNSGLGSSYFARHYFRNRVFFLFLQVLRCFSSLRSLPIHYFTCVWITRFFFLAEFPHSDICGSQDICSLPQLFAACHVLLRLLVPRYPPYALCSLTFLIFRFFFEQFLLILRFNRIHTISSMLVLSC